MHFPYYPWVFLLLEDPFDFWIVLRPPAIQQLSGARAVSQPILSSRVLETLDECWVSSGLFGVSWGLQTHPLTSDPPCTGTEDCEQNQSSRSKGPSYRTVEPHQEPTGQWTHPEADSSPITDPEDPKEAVSGLVPPPPPSSALCLGPYGLPVSKEDLGFVQETHDFHHRQCPEDGALPS